jgi:hypothetical protein
LDDELSHRFSPLGNDLRVLIETGGERVRLAAMDTDAPGMEGANTHRADDDGSIKLG